MLFILFFKFPLKQKYIRKKILLKIKKKAVLDPVNKTNIELIITGNIYIFYYIIQNKER